jgi:hypothetical protein
MGFKDSAKNRSQDTMKKFGTMSLVNWAVAAEFKILGPSRTITHVARVEHGCLPFLDGHFNPFFLALTRSCKISATLREVNVIAWLNWHTHWQPGGHKHHASGRKSDKKPQKA